VVGWTSSAGIEQVPLLQRTTLPAYAEADFMLRGYTLPRTPRGTSSLSLKLPWHYVGDALAVEFEANATVAAAILPEGLELDSGRCAVYHNR
jgi:hypothetical protein